MRSRLNGCRVAVLVADGFEQVELTVPMASLRTSGADARIVWPVDGTQVKGWKHTEWGDAFDVEGTYGGGTTSRPSPGCSSGSPDQAEQPA